MYSEQLSDRGRCGESDGVEEDGKHGIVSAFQKRNSTVSGIVANTLVALWAAKSCLQAPYDTAVFCVASLQSWYI